MAGYVLAIDLGTTATKSMLVDGDGVVIGEHTCTSELRSPRPGFAEMDVETWWAHIRRSVPALLTGSGVTPADIAVVGVSGMVPTLVPVDRAGRALRASIQQNDARAVGEIDELRDRVVDAVGRTGSAITAQSIAPKWMWLRRHEPDVAERAAAIVGSYGFAVQRLTGEVTAESNWSLESGLRTIDGTWASDVLEAAGLDPSLLPRHVESGEVVGAVSDVAASATGLRAGTPVIGGCADHVASAYAAGLAEPGDLLLKLGGAGDVLLVVDGPVVDERLFLDHHPLPGRWLSNGCMASSGSLLRWFERELASGTPLATLDVEAAGIAATADGVLVLPYFLGEKTPLQDPLARGTIAGLHLGHTRAHLYRAVLEAVAFGFEHHLEVFRELELPITTARVTNGGSRSTMWKQVLADVTGLELRVPDIAHGSAYGTALVAGDSVGLFDAAAVLRRATASTVITPNSAHHEALRRHYQTWRALEQAVRPISHHISKEHT
jgi:xylulokinase